jgi:hypothetical protein
VSPAKPAPAISACGIERQLPTCAVGLVGITIGTLYQLLWLNGEDLRELPFVQRKARDNAPIETMRMSQTSARTIMSVSQGASADCGAAASLAFTDIGNSSVSPTLTVSPGDGTAEIIEIF